MGKRQKAWARQGLASLRVALGYRCASCGKTERLEFDCVEPQGHWHHKVATDTRLTFYRRQHRDGNLQLLCEACHRQKSKTDEALASGRLEDLPY